MCFTKPLQILPVAIKLISNCFSWGTGISPILLTFTLTTSIEFPYVHLDLLNDNENITLENDYSIMCYGSWLSWEMIALSHLRTTHPTPTSAILTRRIPCFPCQRVVFYTNFPVISSTLVDIYLSSFMQAQIQIETQFYHVNMWMHF